MATGTSKRPDGPVDRSAPAGPRVRGIALACAAAATLLSGCTTLGPDYVRPDVPLPQAWRSELVDAKDVVNTAWWHAFGDPALDALIQTSIDANKDLMLATLRVEQFDAHLQISRADRYPQVGYDVSAERRRYSEERPVLLPRGLEPLQNAFELGTTLSWELDLWGRVKRANESALADLMASEDARRAVMLTVVTSVATSYIQLVALDRELALARETHDNRGKALLLVQDKYEGGAATRLDVAQAKAAVYEVAVEIPELEGQVAMLENAMSVLLGRNPGPIERSSLATLALPPVPQGIPSDVLSRRPDVLEAEQALISANARIGVAKAQYFPTISLTGLLGLGSNDLDNLLQSSARTGSIGAGLLGTIFDGGRIKGDIRETEAIQKQMLVEYQQAVQTALREVEDALVFRAKAGEVAAMGKQQVDALRDALELSDLRYDGGQSSYLDVLDAQQELYEAQDQQVSRRRDTYLALVAIYKAMGGGWMVAQDQERSRQDGAEQSQPTATLRPPATTQPSADLPALSGTRQDSRQ